MALYIGNKLVAGKSGGIELCTILSMPFGVDESENKYRYLNGQTIIQSQYPAFTAKVKSWQSTRASLFTTEEEWQAIKTASKLGQCGKFVIDDEAGTIRLPAIVNINGLTDLSKCGLIKDESLPNIKGQFSSSDADIGGCITLGAQRGALGGGNNIATYFHNIDASKGQVGSDGSYIDSSKSTYQNGAPVQQEAVQYPYVICVNTGVEEAERPINNYQVNNPYSYGDNKYVGNTILNNLSWLRSVGQENPASVHQDFFNWAVANIGQPFGAGLIKESTATDITEYDLVVNQEEQTFILPTLNGSENTMGAKYSAMNITGSPYNFIAPANGWLYMSGTAVSSNSEHVTVYIDEAKTTPIVGRNPLINASITYLVPVFKGQKVVIEYTASNISRCKFIYAKGNGNLYYYVGDTLQNTDLINIARMQEQLVDKVSKQDVPHLAMPSDKYINLTLNASGSTYTAPADGYVFVRKLSTAVNQYLNLFHVQSGMAYESMSVFSGQQLKLALAVHKGQVFSCAYSVGGNTMDFKFIYAVGSEPTE